MAASAILLVDKPGGITSHDVVARTRKALDTRRVGHAGTLDPMATGLLVLGVESSTRLLTFIAGLDKTYEATMRLGVATDSDDADGVETARADGAALGAVTPERIAAGVASLTGAISQVPSTVSAIKVDGRRAYDLARAGVEVELKSREVIVSRFEIIERRDGDGVIDIDVVVDCASGTYIRALARDLGLSLGVGGHLTALRRTHIGPFAVDAAASVDALADARGLDPADAASLVLGRIDVTPEEARALRQGKRIAEGALRFAGKQAAAVTPDGALIGIVERRGDDAKATMNMPYRPGVDT